MLPTKAWTRLLFAGIFLVFWECHSEFERHRKAGVPRRSGGAMGASGEGTRHLDPTIIPVAPRDNSYTRQGNEPEVRGFRIVSWKGQMFSLHSKMDFCPQTNTNPDQALEKRRSIIISTMLHSHDYFSLTDEERVRLYMSCFSLVFIN